MCAYEYNRADEDEDLERSLKSAVDKSVLLYQQQQQNFAAGVKKGKQLRVLQSAFDKVNFQMRMVFREYASNVEALKRIEARIAKYKTSNPVPVEDLVEVERRQRETSTIIAFKIEALDLLMSAAMIVDKEFVCRVGPVPPVSTTEALPASGSLLVTDADGILLLNLTKNSAAASDHMSVDGDYDENSPGNASPSKRARTASSSSYAEFISGTAFRNAIASRSLPAAGHQKMFGRDAIGNGYDIM
jgi:hypothetical protein